MYQFHLSRYRAQLQDLLTRYHAQDLITKHFCCICTMTLIRKAITKHNDIFSIYDLRDTLIAKTINFFY